MIGELRPAEIGGMKAGRNYLAHADGKADGPHCVSRRVAADETVRVSDGNSATYAQRLRSIREIIQAAIDNRVLSENKQLKNEIIDSYSRYASRDTERNLLDMPEGPASGVITATAGIFRSNRHRRGFCSRRDMSNRIRLIFGRRVVVLGGQYKSDIYRLGFSAMRHVPSRRGGICLRSSGASERFPGAA